MQIFLIPNSNFQEEVEDAISQSKIKLKHVHIYETNPMELTKQIENITKYQERKLDLEREIEKLKNSDVPNKNGKIQELEKNQS